MNLEVTEEEIDKVARLLRRKDFSVADIDTIMRKVEANFDCLDRWTQYHLMKFNDILIKEIGWTYPEVQFHLKHKWKGTQDVPHEILFMLRARHVFW